MQTHGITSLLGLEEFVETSVVETDTEIRIVVKTKKDTACCPICQAESDKVHDHREQSVKDLPVRNKPATLIITKRRFKCSSCQKPFPETFDSIGRYQRKTNRLMGFIKQKAIKESFSSVAKEVGISDTSVRRHFDQMAKENVPDRPQAAPEHLAIDEFAGTTREGKYHLAVGDAQRRSLLDILPDRKKENVEKYLSKLPGKEKVKTVVMDMWRHFRDAVESALPHARIVVDHFHVIRNVLWALDKVRKKLAGSENKELRLHLKRSRFLLLSNPENLKEKRAHLLQGLLALSEDIRLAYDLKEAFRKIYGCSSREEAEKELHAWYQQVEKCHLADFKDLAKTIRNWEKEILNFFDCRLTNGFIEGTNNRLKVIKRQGYGFRNFERFRAKALLICSKS